MTSKTTTGRLERSEWVGTCFKRGRNDLFQNGVNLGSQVRVYMWKYELT